MAQGAVRSGRSAHPFRAPATVGGARTILADSTVGRFGTRANSPPAGDLTNILAGNSRVAKSTVCENGNRGVLHRRAQGHITCRAGASCGTVQPCWSNSGSSASVRISRSGVPALAALPVAVAPHNAHTEGGGRIGIPGVRGLEGDGARRHAKPVDSALIDAGMRLEHADTLDRNNVIEKVLELGVGDGVRRRRYRQEGAHDQHGHSEQVAPRNN